MGLKHRAMHGLLANPDVAPFEVVTKPSERQDWILVDHLTVIHRVRESDYTESEPGVSVASMARTLASWYIRERAHGLSVVLVKDGPGVQKPSVREARAGHVLPPHVEFCKAHLPQIEYAAMKLLANAGMKDNLFLVTGAKALELEPPLGGEGSPAHGGRDNLVSFHRRYEEYCDDEASLLLNRDVLGVADLELSDVDPSYCDGETYRPEGEPGVSDTQSRLSELAHELPRPEYAPRYVFESLCRASEPGLNSDAVRAGENERKRPREPRFHGRERIRRRDLGRGEEEEEDDDDNVDGADEWTQAHGRSLRSWSDTQIQSRLLPEARAERTAICSSE